VPFVCVCVCVCVYRSQIKSGQNPVQLVSAVAVSAFFYHFFVECTWLC